MQEEEELAKIIEDKEVTKAIDFVKPLIEEPALKHSLRTALALAKKDVGKETVIASIVHDTLSDGKATFEELKENFDETIAGLSKETNTIQMVLEKNFPKLPAETMSSLILSISSDIRTIIIQMAELADNLSHPLGNKEKIKRIITIANDIYVPLATKLGLTGFIWQITDNSFKIENPKAYNKIKKLVGKTRNEREELVKEVKKEIEDLLKDKITVSVFGRPKSFKSIFNKLQKTPFKQMHDLYGIRIICNRERECYEILGHIYSKYKFIPEAFDDFIAKEGKGRGQKGYKSIHIAIERNKEIIEIQIRTWQHHMRTESSLYWEYKRIKKDKEFERALSWERQLIEWQKNIGAEIKNKKIIGKKLFAFTPRGEAVSLPLNSTALDFAFTIHSDIGQRAQKAIVNNNLVTLETKLNNLDTVEIITGKNPTIKQSWLNFVISERAKSKIKSYFGIHQQKRSPNKEITQSTSKKIRMAECCHPLPGEEMIGVRTTKRKIIIHKKDCKNILKIPKSKQIEISFEATSGKTQIKIIAVDRPGILGEILEEIRNERISLLSTNFRIKKTGYAEAILDLDVKNINKLEKAMEKIGKLPSIQLVERI